MIRSMTGYGRGEALHQGASYAVEVRSVNHRFCDVSVQLPRKLKPLELLIRRRVQEKFERGRFEVTVSIAYGNDASEKNLKVDHDLANTYINLLKSLKKELGLSGKVDLNLLLQLRDVLKLEEKDEEPDDVWSGVSDALESAIESLQAMRENEGRALQEDISARLHSIEALAEEIKGRQEDIQKEYRQRLHERVTQLIDEGNVDAQRLEQEVVIYAEKSDISEEVARLDSHMTEFKKLMHSGEAVGRKLDFLLQEMNREVNTAASKAMDVAASHAAVNIKSELEKMKQQIQNAE